MYNKTSSENVVGGFISDRRDNDFSKRYFNKVYTFKLT